MAIRIAKGRSASEIAWGDLAHAFPEPLWAPAADEASAAAAPEAAPAAATSGNEGGRAEASPRQGLAADPLGDPAQRAKSRSRWVIWRGLRAVRASGDKSSG
jgi:hypothetical protein